jgi:tetratricopeptide (TPR) repeat protein
MGVAFKQMKRPDKAIRAYTNAIRNNPRMVEAHFNLGMAYLEQGQRKMALDQYEILKVLDAEAAGRLFDRIYPAF